MLLTRPRHSQCSSPTWAAQRLLTATTWLQYYSTGGHSNPSSTVSRANAPLKREGLSGTIRRGVGGDDYGQKSGRDANGRDVRSVARQALKLRKNIERAKIKHEMKAKLSELRRAPQDGNPMDPRAPPVKHRLSESHRQATNEVSSSESVQVKEKPNTILEELFPDISTKSNEELPNSTDVNKSQTSSGDLPKLDPSTLGLPQFTPWKPVSSPAPEQPFLHPDHQPTDPTSVDSHTLRQRLAATVLVISSISRHLALSDFIRLSPRGEHIEGWTSGILRVIPGRDPSTLERQSHYFLLFSTAAAAEAYRDNIKRLHSLSRKWTPTCPTSRPPPTAGMLLDGEDVGALLNVFTIVPNCQKNIFSSIIQKPYRPAVARMIETGGYHPLITPRVDQQGENIVLLGLDQGRMNAYELRTAIGMDGKERNLQWRLEGGEEDVVQLGSKSDPNALYEDEDEDAYSEEELEDTGYYHEKMVKGSRGPPRFLVKFKDSAEARRFVRAWHSRMLEGEVLERLAKAGVGQHAKVSAEILW